MIYIFARSMREVKQFAWLHELQPFQYTYVDAPDKIAGIGNPVVIILNGWRNAAAEARLEAVRATILRMSL